MNETHCKIGTFILWRNRGKQFEPFAPPRRYVSPIRGSFVATATVTRKIGKEIQFGVKYEQAITVQA